MDTEITMMMAVLIAKRKPVNQLSESSEKEYKGVWGGGREEGRRRLHSNNIQGRGCLSQMVVIIRHNQI